MITAFCGVYKNLETRERLIETYTTALTDYTDEDITKAGNNCFAICEYFPKPVDIIKQIKELRGKKTTYNNTQEEFKIAPGIRCRQCGDIRMCIKEPIDTGDWICRQCYTGLSKDQYIEKIKAIIKNMEV